MIPVGDSIFEDFILSYISVTLDTYSHVITEMQAPAIAAMNSILQVAG